MMDMSISEFISEYDSDGKIKNALCERIMNSIKNEMTMEDFIKSTSEEIVGKMECMFECEEIEGVTLNQGYASNVRISITKKVEEILRNKLG